MGSEVCMNGSCKNASARDQWKKGWSLKSGGFARLCNNCGTAYENLVFCEEFHHHETGWRKCSYCNKLIHCGCIASRSFFEYLDFGGIGCLTCVKTSQLCQIQDTEYPYGSVRSTTNNASDRYAEFMNGRALVNGAGEGNLVHLRRISEASESSGWPQAQRDGILSCIGQNSQEFKFPFREEDTRFSNALKRSSNSLAFTTLENKKPTRESKNMHELLTLSASVGTSSGNCVFSSATNIAEGRHEGNATQGPSPLHQGKTSYPMFPKPSMNGLSMLERNKGMISAACTARPPGEWKGKSFLLSRYWPKITVQELEKLSGDLNSTVVPLFDKVLSASDAGRIGRLVLPKACAEAYLPPISQSEGIPLQIQDVKGNEWTFQFRFWPNNNSRMYVLEGVSPCIQSMHLIAGDTVTFSRIDPGGKIVLGFRRASKSIDTQDASTSAHCNGTSTKEATFSCATGNLHLGSSYPDLLQSAKGNGETDSKGHSDHLCLDTGTADGIQTESREEMMNDDSLEQPISVLENRTLNIGPKTKRLHIQSEDAIELSLTWEEAQELLCPPPSAKPNIVTIEDQEFEEYDEPPIFGMRTIFNACPSGPSHSTSEQTSTKESESLLRTSKGSKKRKTVEKSKPIKEHKPSGLIPLPRAAVSGDNSADPAEPPLGATTKHPRHRPGCTCIVCIQPASGQAKHEPSCTCRPCETVKRRFKTMASKRKKQRLELEAGAAQGDQIDHRHDSDSSDASREDTGHLENEGDPGRDSLEAAEPGAGQLDLNCHPNDGEDMQVNTQQTSA